MQSSIKQIYSLFFKKNDEERNLTQLVVKSSAISLIVKAITVVLGLITMPIVYNCLDKYQYGVYVTLTSIISWIDMFDFGIAFGLRNKLTEARTDNDVEKSRMLISSAYAMLICISGGIFLIYCILMPILNWQAILNAMSLDRAVLDSMAFWVVTFFLIRFAASAINNIYAAFQKIHMGALTEMIGKMIYLVLILLLLKHDELTLFRVAVLQSGISAIVPIVAAFYFFFLDHPSYKPSFKLINISSGKDIFSLGWQFFAIQIALLVIHSGNNLLISQFVDPSSVAGYSLSYQLFSYALLAYTIALNPLWPAYTEAWRRGDVAWIKKTMNKMKHVFYLFLLGSILIVIISPWFFRIWIGEKADVPILMTLAVSIMFIIDMWIRIYDFFINGVGKIRVQMIINILMATLNIPIAYLFAVVCNFGAIGVVMATIISYSLFAILSPYQANLILSGKAKGIWNK